MKVSIVVSLFALFSTVFAATAQNFTHFEIVQDLIKEVTDIAVNKSAVNVLIDTSGTFYLSSKAFGTNNVSDTSGLPTVKIFNKYGVALDIMYATDVEAFEDDLETVVFNVTISNWSPFAKRHGSSSDQLVRQIYEIVDIPTLLSTTGGSSKKINENDNSIEKRLDVTLIRQADANSSSTDVDSKNMKLQLQSSSLEKCKNIGKSFKSTCVQNNKCQLTMKVNVWPHQHCKGGHDKFFLVLPNRSVCTNLSFDSFKVYADHSISESHCV